MVHLANKGSDPLKPAGLTAPMETCKALLNPLLCPPVPVKEDACDADRLAVVALIGPEATDAASEPLGNQGAWHKQSCSESSIAPEGLMKSDDVYL